MGTRSGRNNRKCTRRIANRVPTVNACACRREVEALRRISYALHAELEDERRETVEDIARWKSEATASKQEAVSAARRAEEEAMARAIVEARLVSADTGKIGR